MSENILSEDLGSNMSTKHPRYESPNIVIVPTVSFIYNNNEQPAKKQKIETSPADKQTIVSLQIPEKPSADVIPSTSYNTSQDTSTEESKKVDVNSIKKEIKVNSWASNYLNSIGMNTKPIKMNLSISKNKVLEKLAKSDEKNQDNGIKPIVIDTSKNNVCPEEDVMKINTAGCDDGGSKPVEDNVYQVNNFPKPDVILNSNNIDNPNTNGPKQWAEPPVNIIKPCETFPENIEPRNVPKFNTTNKRKYDEFINPVSNYEYCNNNNFHLQTNPGFTPNYYEYTYNIIEQQLCEMEKGPQYQNISSSSSGINYNHPTSHDIFAKSERESSDFYENPNRNSKIFDSGYNFVEIPKIAETKRRSRFDSDSSYSDAKIDEREKRSRKSISKHRSDSRSPYKKESNKKSNSNKKYKERSYSPNFDKRKQYESRRSRRSESYKKRDTATPEPKKSKSTSNRYSKEKPKSNYDKDIKTDKVRQYEEIKKSTKTKVPRSRTPEREQNKRPRRDSETIEKINKKKLTIKSVVQPNNNVQEQNLKSTSPERFDLRSKLSRSNKYHENDVPSKSTDPVMEKIRDNLLVTINQSVNTEPKNKVPSKIKVTEKKHKGKKVKTIQFTIKVLCEGDNSSSVSEESDEGNSGDEPGIQRDLSFLDDFNIDEIVDSLKHTRRNIQKGKNSPKIEKPVSKKEAENCSETLLTYKKEKNIEVKEEPDNTSQDCIILNENVFTNYKQEEGDKLNKFNDCIILDTLPKPVKIKQIKDESSTQISRKIEDITTNPTISGKYNDDDDCVIVESIKTEKIEVKRENIDDSNDCIILEQSVEQIKTETYSQDENMSRDCIIMGPDNTEEIKIEVEKDDTNINRSDDCIIIELVEPIKIEQNYNEMNEIESPTAMNVMEVDESANVDKSMKTKINEEIESIKDGNKIKLTVCDEVSKIPLPSTSNPEDSTSIQEEILTVSPSKQIKQELIDEIAQINKSTAPKKFLDKPPTNDSDQQETLTALATKEIKQELIDENANVTQNIREFNAPKDFLDIPAINDSIQQEILPPLTTEDIKQKLNDKITPTTKNNNELNASKDLLDIPLPESTPTMNHTNEQHPTNDNKVLLSKEIKQELIDNDILKSTSGIQNHDETMNDTTYDSDASTVKLQYDSDEEETDVLKEDDEAKEKITKVTEKGEETKEKDIEVIANQEMVTEEVKLIEKEKEKTKENRVIIEDTIPMEVDEICNISTSAILETRDAAEIFDTEPNKEILNNSSSPSTLLDISMNVEIKRELIEYETAVLKQKDSSKKAIVNSNQNEKPNTEVAKPNQKEAPNTEVSKPSQKDLPKMEEVNPNTNEFSKMEIAKSYPKDAPKMEIAKPIQKEAPTIESAKPVLRVASNLGIIKSSPKDSHNKAVVKPNAKETPKTEIAKSNQKDSPNMSTMSAVKSSPKDLPKNAINKSSPNESPKEVVKPNPNDTPNAEIIKTTQQQVPNKEIAKPHQNITLKKEIQKNNQKETPKTEIIKTSPKTKPEEPEKRQVTLVKNNEIQLSEFNDTKQKLEERMLEYLCDRYTITSLLHNGRFSNIYRCHDSKKRNFIVKMIRDQTNRLSLGAEKEQIFQDLQRDIPREKIHTVFMMDSFGIYRHWAFLMEYYPKDLKRVLNSRLKPFTISQVQELAGQLITALMVLRNNNIVHSDIKPAHILMNESQNKLKLCGFDNSYYDGQVNLLPNIGTVPYRAPEVIVGFAASFGIDIWSTAVVLYEMFTKRRLFNGVYNNTILFQHLCLFGDMPPDMIQRSTFKGNHFNGIHFIKRSGPHGSKTKIVYKFHKTPKFHKYLFSSYEHFWGTRSVIERANDMVKLYGFFKLLEQMLVIDPRKRLTIEFVCTDPFITDTMYT